jgi:WD40 repeat protein
MSDVFISYSRKDIAFARLLRESLQQNQIDTWIDWERIPVGERWWDEICQAIENANVFMFIISKNSIGSPVCKDEINHALKNNKRIIPVIVDALQPEAIKEFAPDLPQFNWIVFQKDQLFRIEENQEVRSDKPEDSQVALPKLPQFEQTLEKLSQAIHTDWDWVKYHTRLQLDALRWESNNRNPSYLVQGMALEETEQRLLRATGKDPQPTGLQIEYVTASRQENTLRQHEQLKLEQKARQRQRFVIWAVGIGLTVAIMLGVVAWGQRNQAVSQSNLRATAQADAVAESNTRATAEAIAVEQRDIAVVRQLAAQARSMTTGRLDEALLIAVEANRRMDLSDARSSLLFTVSSQPALTRYLEEGGWGWGGLAYSPNGQLLAIGTVDHSVLLLDAKNGEPVAPPLTGLSSEVLSLAFSPDGHSLVAGDNAGLVLRWDISNPASPVQDYVYPVGINTDSAMITMASGLRPMQVGYFPSGIFLWNVPASQQVNICVCGVTSLAIAPDGRTLAAGLGSGGVTLLDLASGQEMQTLAAYRSIGGSSDAYMVLDLAFTPDGKKLALSTAYGSVRIWDLINGDAISLPHTQVAPALSRLTLSPDGKTLAYIVDDDSAVHLWDMDSQQFQQYPLQSRKKIISLGFNPDGRSLALGLADNTIQLWDMQSHQPLGVPLSGHRGEVIYLAFSSDGRRLASLDWEHTAIMWDLQAGDRLLTTTDNASETVINIALSADGRYLAAWADMNSRTDLKVWDLQSSPPVSQTLSEAEFGLSPVRAEISFLAETHIIVLYGYAGLPMVPQILFWDLDRRQPVLKIPSATAPFALSKDGRWLAGATSTSGGQMSKVAVWDARTGTLVHELDGSDAGISCLAFSPDGSRLAVGFASGAVRLWRVDDGQPASDVLSGHLDQVTGLAFSPDGKILASSSRDKTIRLWNVTQPATQSVELDGHTSWVTGVAFSPDGQTLASSSLDGIIRLWDTQSHLSIGQLTSPQFDMLFSPVFAPDGSRLFAGGSMKLETPTTISTDTLYNRGLVVQWEFGPVGWGRTACSIAQRNFSLSEWRSYFGTEAYRKTCETLPLHLSLVEEFLQSEQPELVAGGLQAALDDFVKTTPLDPALTSELEASLKTFPLEDLARNTAQHVDTGVVDPAVEMYQALRALGMAERVSGQTWNEVCWFGSLWGQARKVLDICELAVSLDPSNGAIRDSRGLALALTGNTSQAILDFQTFIDWCRENGCYDTDGRVREEWIAALKGGQNPFDDQLLQSLRGQ